MIICDGGGPWVLSVHHSLIVSLQNYHHEVNIRGGGKTVHVVFGYLYRARICKRLRNSGIDPKKRFRQPMLPGGLVRKPISTRFLSPIDCSKIPPLIRGYCISYKDDVTVILLLDVSFMLANRQTKVKQIRHKVSSIPLIRVCSWILWEKKRKRGK
jgi:hypothetical protein